MSDCSRLEEYLHSRLPEADKPGFETHLRDCLGCTGALDSWEQTIRAAQAVHERVELHGPTSGKAAELVEKARGLERKERPNFRLVWVASLGAVTASTALFLYFGLFRVDAESPRTRPLESAPAPLQARVLFPGDAAMGSEDLPIDAPYHVAEQEKLLVKLGTDVLGFSGGSEFHIVEANTSETRVRILVGRVAVEANPEERSRRLFIEAGEALFEVVGTRFIVAMEGASIRLSVERGAVKATVPPDFSDTIRGGQSVAFAPSGSYDNRPILEAEIDEMRSLLTASSATGENVEVPPPPTIEAAPDSAEKASARSSAPARRVGRTGERNRDLASWRELILSGKYAPAERALKRYLKESPGDTEVLMLLGDCHRKQGRWRDSISAYRAAAEKGRSRSANRARFQAAVIYQDKLADTREAKKLLKSFLDQPVGPKALEAEVMLRLARCHIKLNESALAARLLGDIQQQYKGTSAAIRARRLAESLQPEK